MHVVAVNSSVPKLGFPTHNMIRCIVRQTFTLLREVKKGTLALALYWDV